jgi:hypothetical protein
VRHEPVPGVPGDQGDGTQDRGQLDRHIDGGRDQLVVGPTEVAEDGQEVASTRPERFQDLLPQVSAG